MRTLMAVVLTTTLAACGSSGANRAGTGRDVAPEHIHTLAVDPGDGALFAAAHSGLFRLGPDDRRLTLVRGSERDTMGLTVTGPGRFLASGHPPDEPGALGLIESSDAGRSWKPVVLEGQADLHVIRAGRSVFYAHDAARNRLFQGATSGTGLAIRSTPPGTTIDLAVDPAGDRRVFAATDRGFFFSADGAKQWRRVDRRRTGLLAFRGTTLTMVDGQGRVSALPRLGRPWQLIGALPQRAVAFTAAQDGRLYAALVDDSIYMSEDGGRTWRPRSAA